MKTYLSKPVAQIFCNSQLKRRIEFIYNDALIIVLPLLFCLFSASHCSNRKTCSVKNIHSAVLVLDCSGSARLHPTLLHFNGSGNMIRDFDNAANYFSCTSDSHFVQLHFIHGLKIHWDNLQACNHAKSISMINLQPGFH